MQISRLINPVANRVGANVTSLKYHAQLRRDLARKSDLSDRLRAYLSLIAALPPEHAAAIASGADKAESQLGQDLFVLSELGLKRGGFFVEFGATNGVDLSNSFLLEKHYDWMGILAEPARCWHSDLHKNRTCKIDHRCVWKQTGLTMQFSEVESAEYSTIDTFSDSDGHHGLRKSKKTYDVETLSLNSLLERYRAPQEIDYLSIDTEGSELDILRSFDFARHTFRVITCEHNFTPAREEIFALLSSKGYVRKFPELSKWDDWYVRGTTA